MRQSNWVLLEEMVLGPQEGSEEKEGGDIENNNKTKNLKIQMSLPPSPRTPPTPHRVLSRRKIPQPQWLFLLNSPQ